MKVVIAGGTGFLGRALSAALTQDGHSIVILSRGWSSSTQVPRGARMVRWDPNGEVGSWADEITGADAVVNLAGESIAGRRWTSDQKQRILDSRVHATRSLAGAIRAAAAPPSVL